MEPLSSAPCNPCVKRERKREKALSKRHWLSKKCRTNQTEKKENYDYELLMLLIVIRVLILHNVILHNYLPSLCLSLSFPQQVKQGYNSINTF